MRGKHRKIKLHDVRGFVNRMLAEVDPHFLSAMSESDHMDLRTRFAAKMLKISFRPQIFFPII